VRSALSAVGEVVAHLGELRRRIVGLGRQHDERFGGVRGRHDGEHDQQNEEHPWCRRHHGPTAATSQVADGKPLHVSAPG
jgi:hypothetical protein